MGDIQSVGSGDRRAAWKLRAVIDLAAAELRRLGANEEEVQAFLLRRRRLLAHA